MPKLETWLLDKFRPDPNELAQHDDHDETRRLGQECWRGASFRR